MNDLFGAYSDHGCHITHQFIQAQAFKKKMVMIRVGCKTGSQCLCGRYFHPGF